MRDGPRKHFHGSDPHHDPALAGPSVHADFDEAQHHLAFDRLVVLLVDLAPPLRRAEELPREYRNVFGENLSPRRAEKTELFRKLNSFGIGSETSNRVDDLLVYGADDPDLRATFETLVLSDPVYGGTAAYIRAQRDYLEGSETSAKDAFLPMLRSQRQRLFFTLPENHAAQIELWDLTVFRYGGTYLDLIRRLNSKEQLPRGVMPLIMRGLNRVFTGMLVQNQDELVLATSGSHSQSETSPLLDEMISVPRQGGEEVALIPGGKDGAALRVRVARGEDPKPVVLNLTPTRFEFLGRVAEGALPSSFSLECHEDLLMFKATCCCSTYGINDDQTIVRQETQAQPNRQTR